MDQEEQIRHLITEAFKDETLRSAYFKVASEKTFKKGERLIEQGQICRYSYNIVKGAVRGYYLKDGREVTTSFCFEGDPVFSLESATRKVPCKETFETLEDSVIEVLSFKDLFELREQFPAIEKIWTLSLEAYAIWLEERLHHLQFNSARERYELLLKKHPYIVRRIQLNYIASFLGISQETMSRIRS